MSFKNGEITMTKFILVYLCISTTLVPLFGAERSTTRPTHADVLVMVAAAASQRVRESQLDDLQKPLQVEDGVFNLLGEHHFLSLTQKAREQSAGIVSDVAQNRNELKAGDTLITHQPMLLHPGYNSFYSISGPNVKIKKDPANPGYQRCTVSSGIVKISHLSTNLRQDASGKFIIVTRHPEEYTIVIP